MLPTQAVFKKSSYTFTETDCFAVAASASS